MCTLQLLGADLVPEDDEGLQRLLLGALLLPQALGLSSADASAGRRLAALAKVPQSCLWQLCHVLQGSSVNIQRLPAVDTDREMQSCQHEDERQLPICQATASASALAHANPRHKLKLALPCGPRPILLMQALLERYAIEEPGRLEGVRAALDAALQRLIGHGAASLLVPEGDSWSWGIDLPAAACLLQVPHLPFSYC